MQDSIISKILWLIAGAIYRIVGFLWGFLLRKHYGSQKNRIAVIEDPLLLQPASILAANIRNRKVKSEDVVCAYISRIKVVNPVINAVVDQRFDKAVQDARKVDEYIATSGKTPEELEREKPLLGVPFTSKNAIGVAEMIMDAGVVAKKATRAKEDSVVAALMRKAGAIPLCITNVPEACMWNDASCKPYGRTKNPYDLTRSPGGSSGGESSLIASAGSVFGLGNDIGGSVRIPAFSCGIFGHKPTRKIVSNQGQFPSSYRTDLDKYNCTGPLCRYASDLRPFYKVIAGVNESKLKLDTQVDMRKIKIYYTDNYPNGLLYNPIQTVMKEPILKVVKYFEKTHGVKAELIKLPVSPNIFTTIWLSKLGSAKATKFESIVRNNDQPINLPLEFLKWCFRLCNHTLHVLAYVLMQFYSTVCEPEVVQNCNLLADKLDEGLTRILGEDGVLLFPPQPEPAYYHQDLVFKFYSVAYTGIFNILGYPVTMCPIGLSTNGLPLGVQVVAKHFNDHLTLAIAEEIEKAFGGWTPPAPVSVKSD